MTNTITITIIIMAITIPIITISPRLNAHTCANDHWEAGN
jgi:hypothetical protein